MERSVSSGSSLSSVRRAALLGAILFSACNGDALVTVSVARIEAHGVSPASLTLEEGSGLQFVNGDTRAHQIYSSDCAELSSSPMQPGATFSPALPAGPKVCHFQDLLAPSDTEFWGTIAVTPAVPYHDPSDDA